jgi:aminopeptidase N
MKIRLFIVLLALISLQSQAQSIILSKEQNLNNLFLEKKYYELIAAQDKYFEDYPWAEFNKEKIWISAQRIYAWFQLYDLDNVRNDLRRADRVNPEFVDLMKLRYMIDKKQLADIYYESYVTDPDLDPTRDYRPRLTACDTVRGILSPARSCFDVTFYDLSLSIDPKIRTIQGTNKIYLTVTDSSRAIQLDLLKMYEIHSVTLDGTSVEFLRDCDAFFLKLNDELVPGERHIIEVAYSGTPLEAPNPPWNGGFVWQKDGSRYWTGVACEHLGASSWWPVKDHLSDKPDSVRITLRVPEKHQAVANGNLRSVTPHDDKTTSFEWFVSYPINSYNVTYYMGDFVNFNEQFQGIEGNYQVDYYVLKKHLKKAREYYSQTKRILEVLEELYGPYPYPNDGAGFVEAPFRGMEHQGAVAIGEVYGEDARDEFMPDFDHLMLHETAHEWWGNTVAFGDMADAWISETFATYSELLFIEKVYGYKNYLEALGQHSIRCVNAWPVVGARDVNDNTFVTNDIYFKGMAMLNSLRCIIDDDSLFMQIIRGFYQDYKFRTARTEDFISHVARHYPEDLEDFWKVFLYRSEPPVLEYSFVLMAGKLVFDYRWKNVGPGFRMPFCIVVNGKECIRLEGTASVQHYTHKGAETFEIPTPVKFDAEILKTNSFTYFQTNYVF